MPTQEGNGLYDQQRLFPGAQPACQQDPCGRARSRQVSLGRFVCRCSTINCWRRRAFSSISSDLLRVRSRAALRTGASFLGFVQRRRSCLTAWQRASTLCRRKFIVCLSRQSLEAMILPQNEVISHRSRADGVFGQHRWAAEETSEVI